MCSVVFSNTLVLSYQPRDARFVSSKFSWNSSIPADGGGGATVTVTLDAPVLPELVAVTVAWPAATAVTMPLVLTVAVAALLVDHVTVCPVMIVP